MKYIFAILCFSILCSCSFPRSSVPFGMGSFLLTSNTPLFISYEEIGRIDIGMSKEECTKLSNRTNDFHIVRDIGNLQNVEIQFFKNSFVKQKYNFLSDFLIVSYHDDKVIYFGRPEDFTKSSNEDIVKIGEFIFEFICTKEN